MTPTCVLGRIAGVRVGVHWSILAIFTLIALGLAQGRLPEVSPGRAWWSYRLVGLGTAVVFFASLLAHELAHALVARHNGVAVDDLVLWLLGGAARLRREAPTPIAELRIAGGRTARQPRAECVVRTGRRRVVGHGRTSGFGGCCHCG
jgi:Zn-dependent protease